MIFYKVYVLYLRSEVLDIDPRGPKVLVTYIFFYFYQVSTLEKENITSQEINIVST
jgi:hypothetical protein